MGNCLTKKHEVSFFLLHHFWAHSFGVHQLNLCFQKMSLFDEESAHYAISKTHTETQIFVLWAGFKLSHIIP